MGSGSEPSKQKSGLNVLIVEDEAIVAMELEFMLEEAGYVATGSADDLSSALEAVRKRKPDLALVDIQLAMGESGLRVAERLKEEGIAVLFATGNCPGEEGRPYAIGCMHKPIVDRSLRCALAAVEAKLEGRAPPKTPSSVHLY